jgi:hypothetical protein
VHKGRPLCPPMHTGTQGPIDWVGGKKTNAQSCREVVWDCVAHETQ